MLKPQQTFILNFITDFPSKTFIWQKVIKQNTTNSLPKLSTSLLKAVLYCKSHTLTATFQANLSYPIALSISSNPYHEHPYRTGQNSLYSHGTFGCNLCISTYMKCFEADVFTGGRPSSLPNSVRALKAYYTVHHGTL